jgi:hypothetical protein
VGAKVGDGVLVWVGGSGVGEEVAVAVEVRVSVGQRVSVGSGCANIAVGVTISSALLHPASMNNTSRTVVIALICIGIFFSLVFKAASYPKDVRGQNYLSS